MSIQDKRRRLVAWMSGIRNAVRRRPSEVNIARARYSARWVVLSQRGCGKGGRQKDVGNDERLHISLLHIISRTCRSGMWRIQKAEASKRVFSLLKCRATHYLHLGSTSTTSHHDLRHNETHPELHRVHSLRVCVCPSPQHKQIYKPMANGLRHWHYLPD